MGGLYPAMLEHLPKRWHPSRMTVKSAELTIGTRQRFIKTLRAVVQGYAYRN